MIQGLWTRQGILQNTSLLDIVSLNDYTIVVPYIVPYIIPFKEFRLQLI